MINIEDFSRVCISVGQILECSVISGSNKLYSLLIDVGEDKPRKILSGIQKYYKSEDLINKKCLVIVNLESREIMGETSNGMVLCVSYDDKVQIVEPPLTTPIGTRIS